MATNLVITYTHAHENSEITVLFPVLWLLKMTNVMLHYWVYVIGTTTDQMNVRIINTSSQQDF